MTEADIRAVVVAYKRAFRSPNGQDVMANLAKFCNAFRVDFYDDARRQAFEDGKRSVFEHICSMIELKLDEHFAMRRQQPIDTTFEDSL